MGASSFASRKVFGPVLNPIRKRQAQGALRSYSDESEERFDKKRDLQIENLELSNHKLKLKIRKLELELGYKCQIPLTYKGIKLCIYI